MKFCNFNKETREIISYYDKEIHGDNIPVDVVEITEEAWHSAMANGASHVTEDGVLYSKPPSSEDELDNIILEIRRDRNRRFNDPELLYRIERYEQQIKLGIETTDTKQQYNSILTYFQELRDITKQEGYPHALKWPAVPD